MPLELFETALYKLSLLPAAEGQGERPGEEVLGITVEVFTSLRYGLHDVLPSFGLAAWRLLIVVIQGRSRVYAAYERIFKLERLISSHKQSKGSPNDA